MVKKVNISLQQETHSHAKIISILKNIPLNKYLEGCIEKAMKEDQGILHTIIEQKRSEEKNEAKRET